MKHILFMHSSFLFFKPQMNILVVQYDINTN